MKRLVLFFALFVASFAPSKSFAIVASTHQNNTVYQQKIETKQPVKKSTWTTLILSVVFVSLATVLKAAGVSVGILLGCYIAALICVVLCIGTLMKK